MASSSVRDDLEREWVLASARERLLDGMAHAVAERGYAGMSVADALAHAGVARKTFYAYFDNKEDCFLAALDTAAQVTLRRVEAVVAEPGGTPLERLRRFTDAYLDAVVAAPHFARLAISEAPAATPRSRARSHEIRDRFAELLLRATEGARPADLPAAAALGVIEASDRLVARALEANAGPKVIRALGATTLYIGAKVLLEQD